MIDLKDSTDNKSILILFTRFLSICVTNCDKLWIRDEIYPLICEALIKRLLKQSQIKLRSIKEEID